MKEKAEFITGDLLAGLSIVAPFAPKRSTIPILSCVLIEADRHGGAKLTANDLDCQASATVAAAVSSADFRVAVVADHLRRILALVPRDSVCSITRETVETVTGFKDHKIRSVVERVFLNFAGGRYALIANKAVDCCSLSLPAGKPAETIFVDDAEIFRDRLKRVRVAMSREQTRYYLNGVCLYKFEGRTHFVATDGHRMALAPFDDADAKPLAQNYILPEMLVSRLVNGKGIVPKSLTFADGYCRIECQGGVEIVSRLIDASFPEIERVLKFREIAEISIAVDAAPLKAALRRIGAAYTGTGAKGRAATFTFTRDGLFLIADNHEITGTCERVELADPPAETFSIGFNGAYVSDLIERFRAGEAGPLRFVMKSPADPAWFPGDTVSVVIMPLRVTAEIDEEIRRELAA